MRCPKTFCQEFIISSPEIICRTLPQVDKVLLANPKEFRQTFLWNCWWKKPQIYQEAFQDVITSSKTLLTFIYWAECLTSFQVWEHFSTETFTPHCSKVVVSFIAFTVVVIVVVVAALFILSGSATMRWWRLCFGLCHWNHSMPEAPPHSSRGLWGVAQKWLSKVAERKL